MFTASSSSSYTTTSNAFSPQALADDLARSLFPEGSPDAARLKIQVNRNRHLTLSGGRWKPDVVRWLVSKGF